MVEKTSYTIISKTNYVCVSAQAQKKKSQGLQY